MDYASSTLAAAYRQQPAAGIAASMVTGPARTVKLLWRSSLFFV
jgi:hypothetical protein